MTILHAQIQIPNSSKSHKPAKRHLTFDSDHNVAKWIGYGIVGLILAGVVYLGYEIYKNRENIVKVLSIDYAEEFKEDELEK